MNVGRAPPSNAIEVLISALPSEVAASIEAAATAFYSSVLHPIEPVTHSFTTAARTTSPPTATPANGQHSSATPAFGTTSPSSHASIPTSTVHVAAASHHLSGGAIAGIVTGAVAAVVIILLLAWFLLRRHRQGKSLFGHGYTRPGGGIYPEIAWLYDPQPSPRDSLYGRAQPRHDGTGSMTYVQHQHQHSADGFLTSASVQRAPTQHFQQPSHPRTRYNAYSRSDGPPPTSGPGYHPALLVPARSHAQTDSAARPLIPPLVVSPPITDAVPEIISRGASLDQRVSWDEAPRRSSYTPSFVDERPWQVSPIRAELSGVPLASIPDSPELRR